MGNTSYGRADGVDDCRQVWWKSDGDSVMYKYGSRTQRSHCFLLWFCVRFYRAVQGERSGRLPYCSRMLPTMSYDFETKLNCEYFYDGPTSETYS